MPMPLKTSEIKGSFKKVAVVGRRKGVVFASVSHVSQVSSKTRGKVRHVYEVRSAGCCAIPLGLLGREHQVVNGLGDGDEVIVAFGVAGEGDEDVVATRAGDDGSVVMPIFPGAPFADELYVAASQRFDEFDVVVGQVG